MKRPLKGAMMSPFFLKLSIVAVLLLDPSYSAISHTCESVPHSDLLCSHSSLSTKNDDPSSVSLASHNDGTVSSIFYLSNSPLFLTPSISELSKVSYEHGPLVWSVPILLTCPFGDITYKSVVCNILLSRPLKPDSGISDKIQHNTCIHRSNDLIYEIYSSCTSLIVYIAPFGEVQFISTLPTMKR